MHDSTKVKTAAFCGTLWVSSLLCAEPIVWLKRASPASFNLVAPVTFSRGVPDTGKIRFRLVPGVGDACEVVVAPERVSVVLTGDGGPREIATETRPDCRDGRRRDILIKRRATSVSVSIDHTLVMQAACPVIATARGRVGHGVNSALIDVGQVRVQPVGPVRFGDDFMRVAGEMGAWESVAGEWSIAGVGLPEFSANAFCFRGRGAPGLCLAGHWFWEDYRMSASVRCGAATSVCGILVYARDARNGLQLQWHGGKLALIHRDNGTAVELSSRSCAFVPDQWYNLSICAVDGQVVCYVDGALALGPVDCPRGHGRIGLSTNGTGDVHFDDVVVESVTAPAPPALGRRPPVVKASFAGDRYMRAWSQRVTAAGDNVLDYTFHRAPTDWLCAAGTWGVQARWLCQPRWTWFGGTSDRAAVVWHKARTAGDVSIEMYAAISMDSVFDPDYKNPGDLNLTICADGENLNSGYTFIFAGWGNRWTRLLRRDKIVVGGKAPLLPDNRNSFPYRRLHVPWYHLGLTKKGDLIECSLAGKPFITFRDPQPLTGNRAGIWTWGNRMLLARVAVAADQMAPPDLSQYAHRDPAEPGDSGDAPLSACFDRPGATLQTPLPIAGHNLREASRLSLDYRASPGFMANLYVELLGQVHCITFSAPRAVHDCAPVTGRFPDPVLDGQWHTATVDLLAGLNTAYADEKELVIDRAYLDLLSDDHYLLCGFRGNRVGARCELRNVTLTPGRAAAPAGEGPDCHIASLRVAGAFRCRDTFEAGLGRWEPVGDRDGAALFRDRWCAASGRAAMRLTNTRLGGIFGARNAVAPFSGRKFPVLSFDYRATDALRVDLHLCVDGEWRTLKFADYDHTWPVLGKADGVTLDNRWHHADVDLLQLLEPHGLADSVVSDLMFCSTGYPGNEEGLVYRLDNVTLMPAVDGRQPVRIAWAVVPADTAAQFSYVLDQTAATEPDTVAEGTQTVAEFANLTEGDYVFHVRARREGGSWTPAEHLRFRVRRPADATPPVAVVISPAPSGRGLADTAVRLRDDVGIDAASIRLVVNDRTYDVADPALQYDPGTGVLVWDGAVDPDVPPFADGAVVRCSLAVEDVAANALDKPLEWEWTVDYALDEESPGPPYITYIPSERLCRHTFEEWTAAWGNWGGVQTTRTRAASATGRHSLCLTDMHDSLGLFYALADVHVPVREYPWIRFDFRKSTLPEGEAPSVGVYKLFFDGERDVRPRMGSVDGAVPPGGWFNVELDLRVGHGRRAHDPFGILIGGPGRQRGRPGARMYMDNFVVYSRRGRAPSFEWRAPRDATGITGYAWVLDQHEDTTPPAEVSGVARTAAFEDVQPGVWWFHVRAADGAGNWGAPRHCVITIAP